MCIARAHPHLRCSTHDLPNLEPAAHAYLQEHSSDVEVGALQCWLTSGLRICLCPSCFICRHLPAERMRTPGAAGHGLSPTCLDSPLAPGHAVAGMQGSVTDVTATCDMTK
jgi:hypothetical protein